MEENNLFSIWILVTFIYLDKEPQLEVLMSSAYYNNKWKEAINDLLENIHEEFEPLD